MATSAAVVVASTVTITLRRTYTAVDHVMGAVEEAAITVVNITGNKTATVAEALGDGGTVIAHLFCAAIVTLMLLGFRNIANKLFYSRKAEMQLQGEILKAMLPRFRRSFPTSHGFPGT